MAARKDPASTPQKSREVIIPITIERSSSEEFNSNSQVEENGLTGELSPNPTNAENNRAAVVGSLAEHVLDLNVILNPRDELPLRRLSYNVPEKIIIALDCAKDEISTNFEISGGVQYTPLFMMKHALEIFLHNKTMLDARHQFALVLLNENSVDWVHDFTNDPIDIISVINEIGECKPEDVYDLTKLFDLISTNLTAALGSADVNVPPKCVVRTILFYGRSYSIPQIRKTPAIERMLEHPNFTVDIIMTHEPPDPSNHSEKIFRALQDIDTKGLSYIFSVTRNASMLHAATAKLLGHPLQRPLQHTANYDFRKFQV